MGCTIEAHYRVCERSLIRELKLYRRGKIAMESIAITPLAAIVP